MADTLSLILESSSRKRCNSVLLRNGDVDRGDSSVFVLFSWVGGGYGGGGGGVAVEIPHDVGVGVVWRWSWSR